MTNYAQIDTKSVRLSEEFGEQMARKWFGDELVDNLPKYVRGKNKGKPKGYYTWTKVVRGGWVRDQYSPDGGYVENRSGATIERTLCEMDQVSSSQGYYGNAVGKVLARLGQGETYAEVKRAREMGQVIYYHEEALEWLWEFRKDMANVAQVRRGIRDGKVAPEHMESVKKVLASFKKDASESWKGYKIAMASAAECLSKIAR